MAATSFDLTTWNGISRMTICCRPPLRSSISARERMTIRPRPVAYASRMPSSPMMMPPVGKSGPGTMRISSSREMSGLSMTAMQASITSPRLWGGISVANPAEMPLAPFTSRFGKRDGSTTGSLVVLSKLSLKGTVSFSMSCSISSAIGDSRASVYRMAAGGSSSREPQLPWPSMSTWPIFHGWAMRTMPS